LYSLACGVGHIVTADCRSIPPLSGRWLLSYSGPRFGTFGVGQIE
jgi:hypothetical protein